MDRSFRPAFAFGCRSRIGSRSLCLCRIRTLPALIATIPVVTMIAWTPVALLVALVAVIPLIPALIAMTAVLLRLLLRRTRALNLLRRTLKTAELLAQRLNLALVGGLLPLGFFEQFEQLVELVERFPQR